MSAPPDDHFRQSYFAHYAEVLRFVRRRAHPLNVDDIVSETFTIAWTKRHVLPDEPLPWLYRTARNVMLNSARAIDRQHALEIRVAALEPRSVPDEAASLDRQLDVRAAFVTLSVPDQEVISLAVWEDLDARSAAAVIGCSRATYSMRLTRARRRLTALLTEDDAPFAAAHRKAAGAAVPQTLSTR